eukprot:Pgem_evm1s9411
MYYYSEDYHKVVEIYNYFKSAKFGVGVDGVSTTKAAEHLPDIISRIMIEENRKHCKFEFDKNTYDIVLAAIAKANVPLKTSTSISVVEEMDFL